MNQWVFVVLDCELRSETSKDSRWLRLVEKDGPPCKDNFTNTNLLHTTLQTKSSFFVLKVENTMIELTIYIYTSYMLNTVNICSFLIFDFLLLFVTRDWTPIIIILCSSCKKKQKKTNKKKHYSAPAWMTSNAAVWKNKTHRLKQKGKVPWGCF